jgi:cytolysin-activating lysine-acyltransferase
LTDLLFEPRPETARLSAEVGAVVELLCRSARRSYHISAIEYWIRPAQQLRQLKVFYDVDGRAVGYVVWAYLSDALSERMSKDLVTALHFSEWNEGLNLWILDFVAPYGHARAMTSYIRRHMFLNHAVGRGIRRDNDDELTRIAIYRRRSEARV